MKEPFLPRSRTSFKVLDLLLTGILILSLAAGGLFIIYSITVPTPDPFFTEFYMVNTTGRTDYPSTIQPNTTYSLLLGVGNHEGHDQVYLVDAYLLNASLDPVTNLSVINGSLALDQFTLTVPANHTVERQWNFSLSSPTYNRIEFLLYKNESAPSPGANLTERLHTSYRDLHLWVRVIPS